MDRSLCHYQHSKVPQDFFTSHRPFRMISSEETLCNINDIQRNLSYMITSTVPADGMAPLGARAFTGIVFAKFGSCISCGYSCLKQSYWLIFWDFIEQIWVKILSKRAKFNLKIIENFWGHIKAFVWWPVWSGYKWVNSVLWWLLDLWLAPPRLSHTHVVPLSLGVCSWLRVFYMLIEVRDIHRKKIVYELQMWKFVLLWFWF